MHTILLNMTCSNFNKARVQFYFWNQYLVIYLAKFGSKINQRHTAKGSIKCNLIKTLKINKYIFQQFQSVLFDNFPRLCQYHHHLLI